MNYPFRRVGPEPAGTPPAGSATTMRHRTPPLKSLAAVSLWLAVLAAALAACAGGCQSVFGQQAATATPTPLQQVVAGRETLTATLAGLNSAHRLGYLPTAEKQRLEPYRKAAESALDSAELSALAEPSANPTADFTRYYGAFTAAANELLRSRVKADRARATVNNGTR